MLRKLFHLLFGYEHPSTRRIMACEDAVEALDRRVNARYDELKALRGVVSRELRRLKEQEEQEVDEQAPDDKLGGYMPPKPAPASTEHLARRFRSI